MKLRVFFSFLIFFLLNACSYPTRYQDGYSDMRLGENIWRVSFHGNNVTSKERVEDFVLLRSAEIVIEQGYDYFIIVDKTSTIDNLSYTTAPIYNSYSYNGRMYTSISGGQTYSAKQYIDSQVIKAFKTKDETPKEGILYEAKFIINAIKGKYNMHSNDNSQ